MTLISGDCFFSSNLNGAQPLVPLSEERDMCNLFLFALSK